VDRVPLRRQLQQKNCCNREVREQKIRERTSKLTEA